VLTKVNSVDSAFITLVGELIGAIVPMAIGWRMALWTHGDAKAQTSPAKQLSGILLN
jgi:hypothetical protein